MIPELFRRGVKCTILGAIARSPILSNTSSAASRRMSPKQYAGLPFTVIKMTLKVSPTLTGRTPEPQSKSSLVQYSATSTSGETGDTISRQVARLGTPVNPRVGSWTSRTGPLKTILASSTSPMWAGPTGAKDKSTSCKVGSLTPLFQRTWARDDGHAHVGPHLGGRGRRRREVRKSTTQ
jgi:hypothetical protein